ncbi:DUF3800 domain-containing protein [Candidatus Parcubacteria bacterium]|nr:DUF3800 domain-containing protein [Candidatus Parcubacteria bacterium]
MLIYFDESYDNDHKYLLLGALFNPHPRFLHRELIKIKKKYNYYYKNTKHPKEIKYVNCNTEYGYKVGRETIDLFFKSTSYFRSIVIDQNILDLNFFGKRNEDNKIKMARAYKKFAELLLSHNTDNIYNGVLLTDELTRCCGDKFIEIMKQDFCMPNGKYCDMPNKPTLKNIEDIKSHLFSYQVCQINDLLLGCILNNLIPTKNFYKNELRKYLIKKNKVNNLLPDSWNRYSKIFVEKYYPKFNIWYWRPNNTKNPTI